MKIIATAIAMMIAAPAAAQTAGHAHAGHAAQATSKTANADHADHKAGCHKMADGKMMMMKDGKMLACDKPAKAKPSADPHAGHNMSKR